MDVREKLVELLTGYSIDTQQDVECVADHLISNGVTVQEDCKDCAEATQNCIVKLQEQISELRSAQEWVSVLDRLPEENGRYLAVKKRIAPDKLGGNRTDIVILRFFVDDGFKIPTHIPDWINEEINEEVTNWMPLPEPPKES